MQSNLLPTSRTTKQLTKMRLCHIICLSLLVGTGVFCLPVDVTEHPPPSPGPNEPISSTTPFSTARPKREDGESLCCGTHVNKRSASCCGADSPKGCCGADADPKCCGGQKSAEATKPKRGVEGVGNQNESSCCGKNRAVRALASSTTAKPTVKASPETPPEVAPAAPLVTPIRVAREENKSCCGADTLKKVEKPKRSAHEAAACCGGSSSKPVDAPALEDKPKARTTREACCGLKGDEAKKCCGAEAPPAPGQATKIRARRCDQTTVTPIQ